MDESGYRSFLDLREVVPRIEKPLERKLRKQWNGRKNKHSLFMIFNAFNKNH
jgi:hypothetical protein